MYIYQLKATFNVRIRSRGVLKRSTTPYLRSGCTMELDPLPFCCSRLPVDGFDEVPKTCSNWAGVNPCSGMTLALPFWVNIMRMMISASLIRPWEKNQRGDSSRNLHYEQSETASYKCRVRSIILVVYEHVHAHKFENRLS